MLVHVNKSDLVNALKTVGKAVAEKSTTPILSNVYFSAKEKYLEMQSTNFSIGVITKIPANVVEGGETACLFKPLNDLAGKLPDNAISFECHDDDTHFVEIKSGSSKFNILKSNAEDFPKIKIPVDTKIVELKSSKLKHFINRTYWACEKVDITARPMFTGICFEAEDKKLTLSATNTHRLAVIKDDLIEQSEDFKIIIPSKSAEVVMNALENEGQVKISYNSKSAAFEFDDFVITTRLIEGAFPNSDKILKSEPELTVEVDVAVLKKVLDRVALMQDMNSVVRMNFNTNENKITFSAFNPERGWAEEDVPAKMNGDDLLIGFNVNYFADVLKNFVGKKAKLSLTNNLSPIIVFDNGDENYRYVFTPVRLKK